MKLVNKECFETRFPQNDVNYFKIMDKKGYNYFLGLYTIYNEFLYQYLLKYTSILEFDKKMGDGYFTILDDDKDFYQKLAPDNLKYLYIRNNLHVERLSLDEATYLVKKAILIDFSLDEQVEKIIKDTLPKVILELVEGHDEFLVEYGLSDTELYLIPNNSLLIGFGYDEDQFENYNLEQLRNKFNSAIDLCNEFSKVLFDELKDKISVAVRPFTLNQIISVKKK